MEEAAALRGKIGDGHTWLKLLLPSSFLSIALSRIRLFKLSSVTTENRLSTLGTLSPKYAPGSGLHWEENFFLLVHQKWACASNFCEPNFQEFCLKWWRKELFLHCGDELNGLGASWMVLTHGNVIFDILEHSAFQKCSICWVFRSLSCSTSFTM